MTITEFLEARITEDEQLAQAAIEPDQLHPYGDKSIPAIEPAEWGALVVNYLGGIMGEHCARQDPTRVLAECASKRFILTMHQTYAKIAAERTGVEAFGAEMGREITADVLHPLARVYADHPDYRQEWAV